MNRTIKLCNSFFLILYGTLTSLPMYGQILVPGSVDEEIYFKDYLSNDSSDHIIYFPAIVSGKNLGFQLLDIRSETLINSGYPRNYNNGPIWTGRGYNQNLTAGFQYESKNLHITFAPVLYYSQNAAFQLADINPLQHPLAHQFAIDFSSDANPTQIDWLMRQGNSPFFAFHPGQTDIRFQTKKLALGISTQNFTLGPARFNHLMASNSGPGYPHAYIRTNNKIDLKIKERYLGATEAMLFYGLLRESDYFEGAFGSDDRFLVGLALGYEVPGVKGLKLGFNNILFKRMTDFRPIDFLAPFYTPEDTLLVIPTGDSVSTFNDKFDQMASIFIEWKPEETGLRLYFEYGLNDFNRSTRRLLTETEHSRAYTLGLEKLWELQTGKSLRVWYEHAMLARYESYLYRPSPPFYSHYLIRHGYTHRGQLLGAGIGPGSITDMAGFSIYKTDSKYGLTLQRLKFDHDYFITRVQDANRHDVEFTLTLDYMKELERLQWGGRLGLSYRLNRYFIQMNDANNVAAQVFVKYRINSVWKK